MQHCHWYVVARSFTFDDVNWAMSCALYASDSVCWSCVMCETDRNRSWARACIGWDESIKRSLCRCDWLLMNIKLAQGYIIFTRLTKGTAKLDFVPANLPTYFDSSITRPPQLFTPGVITGRVGVVYVCWSSHMHEHAVKLRRVRVQTELFYGTVDLA